MIQIMLLAAHFCQFWPEDIISHNSEIIANQFEKIYKNTILSKQPILYYISIFILNVKNISPKKPHNKNVANTFTKLSPSPSWLA